MQEALAKPCRTPTVWVEVEDVDLHVEKQVSGVLYVASDVVAFSRVCLQVCLMTTNLFLMLYVVATMVQHHDTLCDMTSTEVLR